MRSGRARLILTVVAVVVVLLLLFFFLIKARKSELGDLRTQVQSEEDRTQSLTAELGRLQALQDKAPQLQAALDEIRDLVPQNNQVPNFLFQVQLAANQSGVSFLNIVPELPKPPPEGASVAEVRAQVTVKGGFFAVQDFIRRLTELDRALRIDTVTMTGEQDETTGETTVSTDMSVRVFFELPAGGATGPPITTTTTTTTAPAPTISPTPTPTTSPTP